MTLGVAGGAGKIKSLSLPRLGILVVHALFAVIIAHFRMP
jgi:hypothetical protein